MSEPNPVTDKATTTSGISFPGWLISAVFWPLVRLSFGTGANSYEVDDVTGQRLPVKLAEVGSVTLPVSAAALPLPAGAATSTKQDTLLTALGAPFQAGGLIGNTAFAISGTLPAFAATPTINLGTIAGVATAAKQPALGTAGTPSADVLTVQGATTMSPFTVNERCIDVTFTTLTRPANVTAYSANDSISDNATAGSVTALVATVSDVADAPLTLSELKVTTTDTGLAAGTLIRAYLFNSDPTANSGVGGGDNAAYSQKQAGFVGSMSGTFRAFSDGGVARLVPDEGSYIVCKPSAGGQSLWVQYQTLSAFTPSANSTTLSGRVKGFQGRA